MNGTGGARHAYDPNDGTYGGARHAYDPNDGTYGAYNPDDAYDTYGGYGGFGAAKLVGPGKGQDFNCNAFICFGNAVNDPLFKSLQQKINQLTSVAPATKLLIVDGFIGPGTVTALRALGAAFNVFTTKEQVAADAPTIIATLDALITARTSAAQAGQGPPLAPAGTPVTFTPPTPQTVAVATQNVATAVATGQLPSLPGSSAASVVGAVPKSNTMLLVLGGIAAVLVVGGVGYYVYRRKAQRES
jgi:lysozyme family protein